MRFCLSSIEGIVKKIANAELPYKNTIIIGDNSSGKSKLLYLFIKEQSGNKNTYFIDAVNRGFDVTKVIKTDEKPEYKITIETTRIQEKYFNLEDSFNCYGTLTERIEQIYCPFEEELQSLFCQLTNERFEINYGVTIGEVRFEGGDGLLSSGYQAMIRLMLELLYYQEMGIERNNLANAYVVIDELDEYLSPRYSAEIFEFLKTKFPQMKFIITTHSIDLVSNAKNANLVILDSDGYEVLDVNDYNSYSDVQIVFQRVFGQRFTEKSEMEEILRRLLNNKINHAWSEEDDLILTKLREKTLTASQQLVCKQIMEW